MHVESNTGHFCTTPASAKKKTYQTAELFRRLDS